MYRGKTILGFVPARGGSKGIKNKNIRLFNGASLLTHTIAAALKSRYLDRVVVSTESPRVARIARAYGAEVPFLRPAVFARDASEIVDVVIDALTTFKKQEDYAPDWLMLLQPTSPLRTHHDIDKSIELFFSRRADSLVSICRTENLLLIKDGKERVTIVNPEFLSSANRQKLPRVYRLDGSMLYLVKTAVLIERRSFFAGTLVGYEIEKWRAVDVDEPQDFVAGEVLHKSFVRIEKNIKRFR